MKFVFGLSAYARSHETRCNGADVLTMRASSEEFLPMLAFVHDDHVLSKSRFMTEGDCNDCSHPGVSGLIKVKDGTLTKATMYNAKSVKATRAAVKKAILSTRPTDQDCFLVVEATPGDYATYFSWVPITPSNADLENNDPYGLEYYTTPYTCHPCIMEMKAFFEIESAVTHILEFIPQVECVLGIKKTREEADRSRVAAAKARLKF